MKKKSLNKNVRDVIIFGLSLTSILSTAMIFRWLWLWQSEFFQFGMFCSIISLFASMYTQMVIIIATNEKKE